MNSFEIGYRHRGTELGGKYGEGFYLFYQEKAATSQHIGWNVDGPFATVAEATRGRESVNVLPTIEYNGLHVATEKVEGFDIPIPHICFMLTLGRWPERDSVVDHCDGDVCNIKWANLREATRRAA